MIELNVIQANQVKNYDPTKTTTLRKTFASEFTKRYRVIKADIKRYIVDEDIFGLGAYVSIFDNINPDSFRFKTDSEKVALFMRWLELKIQEEIFELVRLDPQSVVGGGWWPDAYIRKAYEKGLQHSNGALAASLSGVEIPIAASLINLPIHIDRLGLLYIRQYELLRGINAEMSKQISEVLAEGLGKGWSMEKIASSLNSRIDKIGIHRSRLLARTEIIRAHAEATLNNFESFGIYDVEVIAEFTTASHGVCELCKPLEGQRFTIENARGVIPVHPNCRCAWLPIVPEAEKILGR
jgi:SPP1 gp7 family putative phage head morphogenesis protein